MSSSKQFSRDGFVVKRPWRMIGTIMLWRIKEVDFALQPNIKGDLIELRPLRREDFDALFAAASDPLIWEQHPEPDRHTREVFQRYFEGAIESGGALAVIERKTGRIIGSSRYHDLKPLDREVEIGFTFLERAFWGGAYNGELKRLMLDHAFGFVDRVVFVIGETNLRSQKAIQKIGAKFLKKIERPARDGTMSSHLVFAITRHHCEARSLAALDSPKPLPEL